MTEELCLLEANFDDMPGEYFGYVMEQLFSLGALDVYDVPITMKKNRPGVMLCTLCKPEDCEMLTDLILLETSTWGVRCHRLERRSLNKEFRSVSTTFGVIPVKYAWIGERVKAAPEYEDCKAAALHHGVPLREVYQAALQGFSLPQP